MDLEKAMAITCSACKKKYNVGPEHAGKTMQCSCGAKLSVPAMQSPPNPSVNGNSTQKDDRISVQCSCGTKLMAPLAAAGKGVRCKCGKAVPVPRVDNSGGSGSTGVSGDMSVVAGSSSPLFALSEKDWQGSQKQTAKQEEAPKKKELNPYLQQAQEAIKKQEAKKLTPEGNLKQAIWILILLGVVKIGVSIFFMVRASAEADWIIEEGVRGVSAEQLISMVQLLSGIGIGIGAALLACGALAFKFPLSCTITAVVLVIASEIHSFILNPYQVTNIRAWLIKAAIVAGLLQAIRSAADYKKKRKKPVG